MKLKKRTKELLINGIFLIWGTITGRMLSPWKDVSGTIPYIIFMSLGLIGIFLIYKRK